MKHSMTFLLLLLLAACNNNADHNGHADTTGTAHEHTASDDGNTMGNKMNQMMRSMHNIRVSGNNNIDYATMMIEHHKGAVEMSKLLLQTGKDTALLAFANKVIADQDAEIRLMQQVIAREPADSSANAAQFQQALNASMMVMMQDSTKPHNNIDLDYAAQMIPHHQSAVEMAKAYLEHGNHPDLLTLSRNIVAAQEKEIAWLREWLAAKTK